MVPSQVTSLFSCTHTKLNETSQADAALTDLLEMAVYYTSLRFPQKYNSLCVLQIPLAILPGCHHLHSGNKILIPFKWHLLHSEQLYPCKSVHLNAVKKMNMHSSFFNCKENMHARVLTTGTAFARCSIYCFYNNAGLTRSFLVNPPLEQRRRKIFYYRGAPIKFSLTKYITHMYHTFHKKN